MASQSALPSGALPLVQRLGHMPGNKHRFLVESEELSHALCSRLFELGEMRGDSILQLLDQFAALDA
eukprot:2795652-Rhodomonas_salina.1